MRQQVVPVDADSALAFSIKEATPEDDEWIIAREEKTFRSSDFHSGGRSVRYYRNSGHTCVLIGKNSNKRLGHIIGSLWSNGTLWICSIAIMPSARRHGLASRLLEKLIAWGKEMGAEQIKLQVKVRNRPARRLYEKYGFEKSRRLPDYYGPGQHGYLMVREMTGDSPDCVS